MNSQAMHGGGPELSTSSFCSSCLRAGLDRVINADAATDIRQQIAVLLSVKEAEEEEEEEAQQERRKAAMKMKKGGSGKGPAAGTDLRFFVSRRWLQGIQRPYAGVVCLQPLRAPGTAAMLHHETQGVRTYVRSSCFVPLWKHTGETGETQEVRSTCCVRLWKHTGDTCL